jgi:hypothetical protein
LPSKEQPREDPDGNWMSERNKVSESRPTVAAPGTNGPEGSLHPAWVAFVRYCQEMGYGEIERLKIQDGIPVLAEITREKIKFS